MNYLTFIKNTQHRLAVQQESLHFLISGNDPYLRESLLYDVLKQCRQRKERVLIIDDAGESTASDILSSLGYSIKNGLSSGYKLCDTPFKITRLTGLSQLRQILDLVEYDERRKGKLTAYLNFIRQIEMLETGQEEITISLSLLGKYSTTRVVNLHLEKLVAGSIIDEEQKLFLFSKFSECSSAAADFEDILFLIAPFIEGQSFWSESPTTAFVFPLDMFGEDKTLKNLILKLLNLGLTEKSDPQKATVIILDKAYGDRSGILNFILSTSAKLNIFSEDIFTLGSASDLANIFNRFNVRVFGRHAVTSSAQQIEEVCGVIEVTKSSYTVAYDRRWRANKPWDILAGRNKTETYTQTPPTLEPKYRKESIMNLPPNCAILAYRGETTIFSI